MAEEYQLGSSGGNWWQTPTPQPPQPQPRPETGSGHHPHPHHLSNYGWQTDIMDIKTRSSMEQQTDGASASGNSSMVFSNTDDDDIDPAAADQKLHDQESSASGLLAADPTLQMMGLGLSSHNMDWNPASLFHQRKAEGSFRTMLQEEETATANYQQQNDEHWREKLFGGGNNIININDNNNNNEDYKQIGGTCSQDLNTNFQVVDSSGAVYNNTNQNHALLQGLLVSENQHSGFYGYPTNSYGGGGAMHNTPSSNSLNTVASWSKYPHHQFLRGVAAPPPPTPKQEVSLHGGQLQFSNNAPFWNANSSATTVNDSRSNFFPAMQSPLPASNFQEKAKNNTEVRDSAGTSKKNCNDASSKRAREDTTPPAMPAFKVRKEKMGDRITALQQLVSPFGKTDTASVLSEAIEYIKFLHEQVNVLSTPYMKSGAHLHQNFEKPKDPEGPKQDLRTRGLCLVPVSSTFPVTHETTVDYWNPTFGGTFR